MTLPPVEWLHPLAWSAGGVRVERADGRLVCTCGSSPCRHVVAVQAATRGAKLPPPTDPAWGQPPLPEWLSEWRAQQAQAIVQVLEAYRSISGWPKVVILQGPPGSGKTLLAEAVRRSVGSVLQEFPLDPSPERRAPFGRRAVYVCTTRTLQQQFRTDFPYAALLMGRDNYPTANYRERFRAAYNPISAADCDKHDEIRTGPDGEERRVKVCSWCKPISACPYEQAKAKAYAADLVVTNIAYWLTEANAVGGFGEGSRDFIVVDEADELEAELMRHVEVRISERTLSEYDLGEPIYRTKPESWDEWLTRVAVPKLGAALGAARAELRRLHAEGESRQAILSCNRKVKYLERLVQNLSRIAGHVAEGRWVYLPADRADDRAMTFKPVVVDGYGPELVWKHAPLWLLMSGTVISAEQTARDLGIPDGHWRFVDVPSAFDPARRPVYVVPGAPKITHKTETEAIPKLVNLLDAILDRYPKERVLVHTHSYRLAREVMGRSRHARRMLSYDASEGRDLALATYKEREAAVLLAPSLERGVDLPDDLCRVVVVAKVPYPNLGDRQVSARLHSKGGESWYKVQTVRALVQMTGRATRHAGDWSHSYILDGHFLDLYPRARGLFPRWWVEALHWNDGGILSATGTAR